MKYYCSFILAFFISFVGYSQQCDCDRQSMMEVYRYAYQNFDVIKRETSGEKVEIRAVFDNKGVLQDVTFDVPEITDPKRLNAEVKVYRGLYDVAKAAFAFCPDGADLNEDIARFTEFNFDLPLDKELLAKMIAVPAKAATGSYAGVTDKSSFALNVNYFEINGRKLRVPVIHGHLTDWYSGAVLLSDGYYLEFKVKAVSGEYFINYKLHNVKDKLATRFLHKFYTDGVDATGKAWIALRGKWWIRDENVGYMETADTYNFDFEIGFE